MFYLGFDLRMQHQLIMIYFRVKPDRPIERCRRELRVQRMPSHIHDDVFVARKPGDSLAHPQVVNMCGTVLRPTCHVPQARTEGNANFMRAMSMRTAQCMCVLLLAQVPQLDLASSMIGRTGCERIVVARVVRSIR